MIHVTAEILDTSIILLIVAQVIVSLLLILVVLMQRPKQEGLGAAFGGGMTDQMFGARTTNVLQKATVWFGILFFGLTLLLAILQGMNNTAANKSIAGAEGTDQTEEAATASEGASLGSALDESISADLDKIEQENQTVTPAPAAPVTPAVTPEAPATPAAPAAPVEEVKEAVSDAASSATGAAQATIEAATEKAGETKEALKKAAE